MSISQFLLGRLIGEFDQGESVPSVRLFDPANKISQISQLAIVSKLIKPTKFDEKYLRTKMERSGHMLDDLFVNRMLYPPLYADDDGFLHLGAGDDAFQRLSARFACFAHSNYLVPRTRRPLSYS